MTTTTHTEHLAWLALGIGEWSTALAHIESVARLGHVVPTVTKGSLERELGLLCLRWAGATGWPTYDPSAERVKVIEEARTWASQHLSEIDAVTTKEVTDGSTQPDSG